MYRKHNHRVGATRAAWLSLSASFVHGWDRAACISTSPKLRVVESHIVNDELAGNPGGRLSLKSIEAAGEGNDTGTGNLTDQYLKDRAAMLSWQLQFGFNDTQPVGDTYVKLQGGTPFYFEDFSSNTVSTKMRIGGGDTTNAVMSRPLGDFNHNPRGLTKDGWRAAA